MMQRGSLYLIPAGSIIISHVNSASRYTQSRHVYIRESSQKLPGNYHI